MPSTISAGTTAGTAIAIAGDTTGNLAFQTNGTTTAMTINTSQNVGIGTSSPSQKLDVSGIAQSNQYIINPAVNTTTPQTGVSFYQLSGVGPAIAGYQFAVITGNDNSRSERMRINSVGSREYTTYNSGNIYGGDAMIGWDNVSAFSIDLTTLFPNLIGTGSAVSLLIQGITWNGGSASSQSFLLNGARGNSSWAFSTANTVNTGTGTSVTPSASGNTLTITFGGGGQYGNAKISIIARN